MTTFMQFVVIGLATGAVYALLAQGVVVIHRASGIVNFAQGAFAVTAGFQFVSMTKDAGWDTSSAFAVVVVVAGVLGAVVYWGVVRPLRGASQLTQVIVTLAALLILQALATLRWGANTEIVPPFLSTSTFKVGDVTVQVSQVILFGLACGLTLVLWAFARFTLPGIAIRAVAENRRATAALGWSPDVMASGSWIVGCALGAAAGMLVAPVTGVQVNNMTLLLVATLAAALVGGFSSFPLTLLGAMAIGIGQAEISNYVTGIPGAADAFPFLAIVVLLIVRGRGLPARGHVGERLADLGAGAVHARVVIPLAIVLGALTLFILGPLLAGAIATSLIFAIVLLSIVVLTGYTGQLSLAQLTIGGIGALVAGRLVADASWGFAPAVVVGVLAAIPVGLVFAIPALRTRGMTLALVTFGLASAVTATVFTNGKYIGGLSGTEVGSASLFGWDIDMATHPERYAVVALVAFVICALVVANIRRGRVGRRLIAVRSNERAAAALGVNVYGTKLYAFGVSAAIAALGGILLGFSVETIQYDVYDPFQSVVAMSYGVIGGLGYVAGALFGALLAPGGVAAWLLEKLGTDFERYLALLGGVGLLMVLLLNPNGLAADAARLGRRLRGRLPRAKRTKVPEALPHVSVEPVAKATVKVSDLVVRFGGVTAVDGVSMTLSPGRISGLIGPNGAGKTTVIDAVTGFVRPAAGSIQLDDRKIGQWPTHRRARAGVSRSFQALELFEGVSVRENLLAASEPRDGLAYATNLVWSGQREVAPAAVAAIREFGLEDDLDRLPRELPYGRRRLVAIARAVASQPSVLLLDEPAAGLDESEVAEIATLVRRLATSWGIAILLVEHDMGFVMSVCDDITVIDFGRQIAQGTPEEVRADPKVIAAYLGQPESDVQSAAQAREGAGR